MRPAAKAVAPRGEGAERRAQRVVQRDLRLTALASLATLAAHAGSGPRECGRERALQVVAQRRGLPLSGRAAHHEGATEHRIAARLVEFTCDECEAPRRRQREPRAVPAAALGAHALGGGGRGQLAVLALERRGSGRQLGGRRVRQERRTVPQHGGCGNGGGGGRAGAMGCAAAAGGRREAVELQPEGLTAHWLAAERGVRGQRDGGLESVRGQLGLARQLERNRAARERHRQCELAREHLACRPHPGEGKLQGIAERHRPPQRLRVGLPLHAHRAVGARRQPLLAVLRLPLLAVLLIGRAQLGEPRAHAGARRGGLLALERPAQHHLRAGYRHPRERDGAHEQRHAAAWEQHARARCGHRKLGSGRARVGDGDEGGGEGAEAALAHSLALQCDRVLRVRRVERHDQLAVEAAVLAAERHRFE